MTVYDIEAIELAYAPPYGAPRDVVNLAGAVATSLLREKVRGVAPAALPAASRDLFVLDVARSRNTSSGPFPAPCTSRPMPCANGCTNCRATSPSW